MIPQGPAERIKVRGRGKSKSEYGVVEWVVHDRDGSSVRRAIYCGDPDERGYVRRVRVALARGLAEQARELYEEAERRTDEAVRLVRRY